jgi:Peptidase S46
MKIPGIILVCALALPMAADEGMWLFNQFPKDQVKKSYSFEVTDQFLEDLRLASVKIGANAGSFVSANGLILTDHSAVADCVAKLSSAQHDYVKDGFYGAAQTDELPCPGIEASVLVGMEDVTSQVKEAAPAAKETTKNLKAAAAADKATDTVQKRNAAIARLEKACADKTGNTCSVVKLSSGERYDLYQYKKYSDLRLVFSPELAMANFGGDRAIFTYQRYQMDVAFVRAYQQGKPAQTPHFLKWSAEPMGDTELLFTAGSPASTSRLDTSAQLIFYRDQELPLTDKRIAERIKSLAGFVPKGEAQRQVAEQTFASLGMAYKYNSGLFIGLTDERLMIRKATFEKRLRNAVEHDPKLGTEAGKMWDDVAAAYKTWTPNEKAYQVLESPGAVGSALFRLARGVLRLSEERAKPNDQRLPGYHDSELAATEAALYAPVPIDEAVETSLIATYLGELKALGDVQVKEVGPGGGGAGGGRKGGGREGYGRGGGPPVEDTGEPKGLSIKKLIPAGKTAQQAAEDYVHASKLADVAERKRLANDRAAAQASDDGMLRLVRQLDEPARKLLKKHQDTLDALAASSAERIAQYRFRLFGPADYPDATSTPRVSYGVVKPYRDRTEAAVLAATTFGGLFHLATDQAPNKLPQRWIAAKADLDLVAPFNFVSTCDTSSGSSGSPTVNKKGELVGMVFDANLEALPSTYAYTDDVARAVHVSVQGIVEALRKIYKTPALLKELGVPQPKGGTE